MTTFALIPARGGSKGVPRKNLAMVAGKPLIAWTIEAALRSCVCNSVIVSTDDPEIADVARSLAVPVQPRPAALGGDETPMIDVVRHCLITHEESQNTTYDYCLLLQPTAPMRTNQDIDRAMRMLKAGNFDSIISVYRVEDTHPARMYKIDKNLLQPIYTEPTGSLRQDLPAIYHRNGAIYACTRKLLINSGKLWGGRTTPYVMPRSRSINIDDITDLRIASALLTDATHGIET